MDYGKTVTLEHADPGHILLRATESHKFLFVTIKTASGNPSVLSLSPHESLNGILSLAAVGMTDTFWDITEIATVRPDLNTHAFHNRRPVHGQLFFHEAHGLVIVGAYPEALGFEGHYECFRLETGEQVTINLLQALTFEHWRLVSKTYEEIEPFYEWASKAR
jgi:hypothetical protein